MIPCLDLAVFAHGQNYCHLDRTYDLEISDPALLQDHPWFKRSRLEQVSEKALSCTFPALPFDLPPPSITEACAHDFPSVVSFAS